MDEPIQVKSVKAEDLQIGDRLCIDGFCQQVEVADLFYRTNTLARTQKKGKGLVVVAMTDFTTRTFPVGHMLFVVRPSNLNEEIR